MSNTKLSEILVSLPTSHIKAPGNLLRDKKVPIQVKTNMKCIKDIFQNTLDKTNSTLSTQSSYRTPTVYQTTEPNFTLTDGFDLLSPKESPKSVNHEVDDTQISIAKRILLTYGIELIVDVTPRYYQQTIDVIKVLVSEVCTFHRRFFNKIRLYQIIICQKGNLVNFHTKENVILVDELIKREDQVQEIFHKIILSYLVSNNLELFYIWKETRTQETRDSQYSNEECRKEMEENFLILMAASNNRSLKPNAAKFQNLLMKYYPDEMSSEWFRDRIKDKKKMFRVSFLF